MRKISKQKKTPPEQEWVLAQQKVEGPFVSGGYCLGFSDATVDGSIRRSPVESGKLPHYLHGSFSSQVGKLAKCLNHQQWWVHPSPKTRTIPSIPWGWSP